MATALSGRTSAGTLDEVAGLARRYRVPVEDALLISLNLYGIASSVPHHRARLSVRLDTAPSVPWQIIVPLDADDSPFRLDDAGWLRWGDEPVAVVERVAADEAVGGYFRHGGRAATLNPNARSRCVGCAFCPNTLEAAADPRLAEERGLDELLTALREQHPQRDLSQVEEVTVSTGCFEREQAAVQHLVNLRSALGRHGIDARVGFLTSVLRTPQAFAILAELAAPFVLRLTAECFTRRDLLLKASKAAVSPTDLVLVLRQALAAGHSTSFTYIAGLDELEALRDGMASLAPYVTEFPNIQVYQAHNPIMGGLRAPGAHGLEYYLQVRKIVEEVMAPSGLRPAAWECYRPLWYFTFADEPLAGA
ncbi:hypothetical protein [Streptomyces aidingensis]|uniref:Uncharacterized protein n=1 Tax=Streptomyces aidingensis TaxID=910347 RepID=A0A1I1KMB5_9ACTN|nr:hypothetical protein [Streptomyces aidingensis]SFC61937.1 hypothetical protein SAMN05421773_104292 [Streptomyces aidingensis]